MNERPAEDYEKLLIDPGYLIGLFECMNEIMAV